jgi:transposase
MFHTQNHVRIVAAYVARSYRPSQERLERGSGKNSATPAGSKMACHASVAWRPRHGFVTSVNFNDHHMKERDRLLGRSYLTVTKDLTRVMNRLKALYRSWAIPCAGEKVYSPRHRSAWLEKLSEVGVRRRAEQLYQQLDMLLQIRREARRELLTESRKHPAQELLRQIPRLGPIRVALVIALLQTPHRFRTKRQLWAYCGLALQTRSSGEYRFTGGQLQHSQKLPALRGLNINHNHDLKNLFKSVATHVSTSTDPLGDFYRSLLAKGMKPAMARLTLARKMAAIVLMIWKKGERFDPGELKRQAA